MMAELSLITKATLILAVALFATRAARRAPASVRSLILTAAFGLVLVLPIASTLAPAREVQIPEAYATRFLIAEETTDQRTDLVGAAKRFATTPTPAPSRLRSPQVFMRTAWLLGTVATLLPLLLGLWRLRIIRRNAHAWSEGRTLVDVLRESVGVRRTVAVVLHEAVAAPMTCGWMRPTIAMPADAPIWPASEVRQALLHELEHVRRLDWPVHILARLTCSLYWFHPAAWVAWRQLSLEAERACDDAVVTQAEHTAYAEQLVSLARRLSKGRSAPLLSMADHRTLSRRIASILSTTTARGRVGTLAATLVVTAAAALAAAIAPVKAIGAQPRERDALTIPTSTDGPTFEVVSVKPNEPDDRLRVNDWQPVTGRLVLRNLTPKVVLTFAYANSPTLFLPDDRLVGVPEWADKERFTIEAIAGHPVTAAEMQRMLRRVLVDRFGLRVHLEQREQASYRLVTARPDRRLGPNLHPSDEGKCKASRRPRGGSDAWGPQELICTTIDLLAGDLSERLGRPVLNQTGLTGLYDGTLSYAPSAEELAVIYQLTPSELPPAAQTGPSLTTALREQLGLRLESTRAAIDVLVVDGLVRPTPNDGPEVAPGGANQGAPPRKEGFEVASIKRNVSGAAGSGQGTRPGGVFTATNVSLLRLVQFAYDAFESQIVGGPDWIRNDRFDVTAKTPADARQDQMRPMMRALLEERFKLRVRTEKREMSMFELLLARSDGRLGPNLHDCSNKSDKAGLSSAEKPFTAPRGGSVAAGECSRLASGVARLAAARMQSPVIDKTGLDAEFRYDIYFGPDLPQPDAANPDLPSFATALREQLGLKLERARGIVDVLVIDSVEQPTED